MPPAPLPPGEVRREPSQAALGEGHLQPLQRLYSSALERQELSVDVAQRRVETFVLGLPLEQNAYEQGSLLPSPDKNISGICTTRDGLVVTSSWEGWIRAFDVAERSDARQDARQICIDSPLVSVAASPCSPGLVGATSVSADVGAALWNMDTRQRLELSGHSGHVSAIDFHAQEPARACTAGDDGRAIVWDCAAGAQLGDLSQHGGEVLDARFLGVDNGYSSCLATACVDGLVRLWDLRQPAMRAALHAGDEIRALAAHGACHLLAAGTDNGTAALWDLRTLQALQLLDLEAVGCQGAVASLAFAPNGSQLALGSAGGGALVLDFGRLTWRRVGERKDPVLSLCWAPDWRGEGSGSPCGLSLLYTGNPGYWAALQVHEEVS